MPALNELNRLWRLAPGNVLPSESYEFGHVPSVDSALAIAELAAMSVGVATLAAKQFGQTRNSRPSPQPTVIDIHHALASWAGHIKVDGEPVPQWADLSGRYSTADGRFVQLHCNFAHHAQGVADYLGVGLNRSEFEAALLKRNAFEVEAALIDRGMICAVYRSLSEWDTHPHATATKDLALLDTDKLGSGEPLRLDNSTDRPLDGIKVLDCTRVLAGPTCGQTLAAHGAEVLRVGAAHLPSIQSGVLSTGFGKRNTFIDLSTTEGAETFRSLLADAHILIDAYRPGALAKWGFSAADVSAIRPGIVVVEICAFDWIGPWASRRGFDSILQTTTGLAMNEAERNGSDTPVHLPVQALDYATGYLAAFAAMRLLDHQQHDGGSWRARLSLLRTRDWLMSLNHGDLDAPTTNDTFDVENYLIHTDSSFGRLESVTPVAGRWDIPPTPLGTAEPRWR